MGHPHGDPVFPGRQGIQREMVLDRESFQPDGDGPRFKGGICHSDDKATLFLQGSTQYDAVATPGTTRCGTVGAPTPPTTAA
jgi:hypothetical protein